MARGGGSLVSNGIDLAQLGYQPQLRRALSELEKHVVWAALWANVRDVHQPAYNLTEAAGELQAADALLAEWNELSDLSADEKEIVLALAHVCLDTDQMAADWEAADRLVDHYDALINVRHGHATELIPVPTHMMSLHVPWAKAIYSGVKKHEFRCGAPRMQAGDWALIYETKLSGKPDRGGKVTGMVQVADVICGTPHKLAELEQDLQTRPAILKYLLDGKSGVQCAYQLGTVVKLAQPMDLDVFGMQRGPYSYQRLKEAQVTSFLAQSTNR